MSPNQIKVLVALVNLKKESTLKEISEVTGLTKTAIKGYTKNHPLFKWDYTEPFGKTKAELFISLTDDGVEYAMRYGLQVKRITGKNPFA